MFERFTDNARKVVVLAQEASINADQNYIGVEHLLVAVAKYIPGYTEQQVMDIVNLPSPITHAPPKHRPFTPEAKKVMELALREALQLGHSYVDTNHLVLALVRPEDVKQYLPDPERIRQDIITELGNIEYTVSKVGRPEPSLAVHPTMTYGQLATKVADLERRIVALESKEE